MNTKINYLYRDASNYKVHNECVISGPITEEEKRGILECCSGCANGDDGINPYEEGYFKPEMVGMPAKRFETWTEDDHEWFELNIDGFSETDREPNLHVTAKELLDKFLIAAKASWNDEDIAPVY